MRKSRRQIQAEIQQMEDEIPELKAKIKQMKARKKFQFLQNLSFFTPFIKALFLTAVILLIYAQFGIN